MAKYNTFDVSSYNGTEEEAIEFALGMDWSDVETKENNILYGRYVTTVNDVEVHYDYGADYYFFCDATEFITLYKMYDRILDASIYTETAAIECAEAMDWSEIGTIDMQCEGETYITAVNNTEVYHSRIADSYFFCPVDPNHK